MGMEEPLEPNGATISWLRLVQSAPVSVISRTPKCSKVGAIAENTIWGAPAGAGFGAGAKALPKRAIRSLEFMSPISGTLLRKRRTEA